MNDEDSRQTKRYAPLGLALRSPNTGQRVSTQILCTSFGHELYAK
jgi:hypothetical protein